MAKSANKPKGKSLADFRSVHDKSYVIPLKITEGLAALGDGWEYEPEFIKLCGVSPLDFARFRDEFEAFYVTVGGSKSSKRAWAGTKAIAEKMRGMI